MMTGAETVTAPWLSVARAVSRWLVNEALVQVNTKGGEMKPAKSVSPSKNSTRLS